MKKMEPYIIEKFADNGAHSHWSVIDKNTGEILIEDIADYAIQPVVASDAEDRCPDCGGLLDENDECPHWYSEWPPAPLN